MSTKYGPKIITNGLVFFIDGSNSRAVSGNKINDVSGNGYSFTINGSVSRNVGGYFNFPGNSGDYITGPLSSALGLNQEHTLEFLCYCEEIRQTVVFYVGNNSGARAILTHVPWSDGTVYYDVAGCCGADTRISYSDSAVLNSMRNFQLICRTSTTPRRRIISNNVEQINSGANNTATITYSSSTNITIGADSDGNNIFKGRLYYLRLYNRALTPKELEYNYMISKLKYNLP